MSLWVKIKEAFNGPAPQPPVVLDDFVKHGLQKLMDDVVYDYDNTFTTREQVVEFIYKVLDGFRPVVIHDKTEETIPNKKEKIRLKPLTINQK